MSASLSAMDIERLLAEADELVQRINSDVLTEMEEERRLQFEMHARNLDRIKSEIQARSDKQSASKTGSGAEGFHEAILDIIKAMKESTKLIS